MIRITVSIRLQLAHMDSNMSRTSYNHVSQLKDKKETHYSSNVIYLVRNFII